MMILMVRTSAMMITWSYEDGDDYDNEILLVVFLMMMMMMVIVVIV